MADSIETSYLNMPPSYIERSEHAKKSKEFWDEERKLVRDGKKQKEHSKHSDMSEEEKQDSFKKEAELNEQGSEQNTNIQRHSHPDSESPGFLIDVII